MSTNLFGISDKPPHRMNAVPLLALRISRIGLSFLRTFHPWAALYRCLLSFFILLSSAGHICFSTNLSLLTKTSANSKQFFLSKPPPPFSKFLLSLILILILLFMSGDIYLNPGPIHPALFAPIESPGETKYFNVITVLDPLWSFFLLLQENLSWTFLDLAKVPISFSDPSLIQFTEIFKKRLS